MQAAPHRKQHNCIKKTALNCQRFAPLALISGIATATLSMSFNLPTAIAQEPNCQNPQTQMELNQCSSLKAKAADRELNQVYQQVQKTHRSAQLDKLLVESEAAWIKYRDASCKFEADHFKGGSAMPLVYNTCLERLTKQRIEILKTYLQEGS